MFGAAHLFDSAEIKLLYSKVFDLLEVNGRFIIKSQFGLNQTVDVNYSEEMATDYFAQYRTIYNEIEILASCGFKLISVSDIYPKEFNRYQNTHFFAIILTK
jgi:hypothetical protein